MTNMENISGTETQEGYVCRTSVRVGLLNRVLKMSTPAWSLALFLLLRGQFCCGNDQSGSKPINPCCHYPCENWGVCMRIGLDDYECDCTRTGYYGKNCSIPEFWSRIHDFLRPNPDVVNYILTHFKWLWDIVNATRLRDWLMGVVLTVRSDLIPNPPTYNTKYDYLNWEAYSNITFYTRILPPIPQDCPTPMGVKGKRELPDPDELANKLMLRRKFRPEPRGTNLMFGFFAQHFTHQFFKTNHKIGSEFTLALGHGVDAAHIYGYSMDRQLKLRLLKDGKLKYQVIDGEVYPPTVAETDVSMIYPPHVPEEHRLAIGEDRFGLLPGLTMYATLWLREHNRVCDVLKAEHPTWDDEQLYQTARLIIIGEIIRIVIEDYVQHLSGYNFKLKFDPTLMFGSTFQYGNRIALEFAQLYHWHPLMPDSFFIDGDEIQYPQFLFNASVLINHGVDKLIHAFTRQHAGQIGGGYNMNAAVTKVAANTIRESRHARIQPFNQYRKRFHLTPYTSFRQFTDDEEMIQTLEEMYGDIDALEFYPGLLLEKTRPGAIFGQSMVEMGAPFSLKGLMGNAICAPHYWKPSTFGGQVGFDLVNSATLAKLVCLNTKTCPYVAFQVPPADFDEQKHAREPYSEL